MKQQFDAAYRQYALKTVQGEGFVYWKDGVNSVFPSVKLLGKTTQGTAPALEMPQEVRANQAKVKICGKNLANAFIDNQQYRAKTEKLAENKFRISRDHPTNYSGYGQLKIEGLPVGRALQLVITWERDSAIVAGGNPAVRAWKEANASEGSYGSAYFADETPRTEVIRFTTQTGYMYLGIYPQAADDGGSITIQLSVYPDEYATLEHTPYFDGGEATAPSLMSAVDGSCQSSYDPQTGEFVNWWWDKLTFDGSSDEDWSIIGVGGGGGAPWSAISFAIRALPEDMDHNACWSNQAVPRKKGEPNIGSKYLCAGIHANPRQLQFPGLEFIGSTLELKDILHLWEAHLAEHPLEIWVARNEPEITNIGAQRLICPTGIGQVVRVAGDGDCPVEIQYLAMKKICVKTQRRRRP